MSLALDQLGNAILFPTIAGGREYWSKFNNGHSRYIKEGQRDQDDPSFFLHDCQNSKGVYVDGKGVLTITDSNNTRPYIVDKDFSKTWLNVEFTDYCMRIDDVASTSDYNVRQHRQGIRSNHFVDDINKYACSARGYHGEANFNSTCYVRKEVAHPGYTLKFKKISWTYPKNKWVGWKTVVQNCNNNTAVRIRMYRDLTDGLNGGTWDLVCDYTDTGNMTIESDAKLAYIKDCISNKRWKYDSDKLTSPLQVNLLPAYSCFIRMNNIKEAKLKKLTIREIAPLP